MTDERIQKAIESMSTRGLFAGLEDPKAAEVHQLFRDELVLRLFGIDRTDTRSVLSEPLPKHDVYGGEQP